MQEKLEKTVETITLKDILNQDGRSKCKDFIKITDANNDFFFLTTGQGHLL